MNATDEECTGLSAYAIRRVQGDQDLNISRPLPPNPPGAALQPPPLGCFSG